MLELKSTTAAIAAALIAAAPACFAQTAAPGSTGANVNPPVGGAPAGPFNGAVIQPGGGIGTTPGAATSNIGTAAGVGSGPASSPAGSSSSGASALPDPFPPAGSASSPSRGVLGPAPTSPGVIGGGAAGSPDATGPCTPRSALDRC